MLHVKRVHVKNKRLWKFGIAYPIIFLVLLALNVGGDTFFPLLNVFLALVFLVLAS